MKTVIFVCMHGASRSRIASAYFNRVAPSGWTSLSAGIDPQGAVSDLAVSLMTGTSAESLLDRSPPRAFEEGAGDVVVAIDCGVTGATRWDLTEREQNQTMRDELWQRVEQFAETLR